MNNQNIRDGTPTKSEQQVSDFLKDKNGNHSLRELVILVCLLCLVASWIAQQFFQLSIPEYMFYAFVSLIGAGCFGYSIEKKSNINSNNEN